MIFFYGEGRLGNQIFQYQAICAFARPGQNIVAVGLEDLPQHFEIKGPNVRILTRSVLAKRLIKFFLLPFVIRPLVSGLRLANYVHEPVVKIDGRFQPAGELSFRRGILGGLTFVDGGYYQNPSLWPIVFSAATLSLREPLREAARRLLTGLPGTSGVYSFVHVRRGDYLNYKAYGVNDLCLPAEFYRAAIAELRRKVGSTHLVFITDDPAWVQRELGDVPDKTVVSNDATLDFAVMTECANGIVSNSTFSLAAALIMPSPGLVIAPEFWFGFRAGEWYPPGIRCKHPRVLYLSVPASA